MKLPDLNILQTELVDSLCVCCYCASWISSLGINCVKRNAYEGMRTRKAGIKKKKKERKAKMQN